MMTVQCAVADCSKAKSSKGFCGAHYMRFMRHGDPLAGNKRSADGLPKKFYETVVLTYSGEECLIWPFSRDTYGYGQIRVENKIVNVHRYVCLEAHGIPIDESLYAAHSCGKGHEGCVNPLHLSWKTPQENQDDRIIHGTHSRGSRNPSSKLTDTQVLEIIALRGTEKKNAIAKRYGISLGTVSKIHRREAWSWLTTPPNTFSDEV